MLELYRAALHHRRADPDLGDTGLVWLDSDPEVLSFRRGQWLVCLANLSARAVSLPPHERVILASGPLTDGMLPPDTAVWLHTVH
jgi:alpha-glucosidase